MEVKLKDIKKIIMILFILIIIIGIILIIVNIVNKNKENIKEEYEVGPDQDISYNISEYVQKVENHQMYYTIENILQKYISLIQDLNGDSYIDETRIDSSIEDEKQNIQKNEYNNVTKLIDEQYVNDMQMTRDKFIQKISKYKIYGDYKHEGVEYLLVIDDIYLYEISEDLTMYFVSYSINGIADKIIVKLDSSNITFSLFLGDYIDKYNYSENTEKEEIKVNNLNITDNNINTFSYARVTDENIVKGYLQLYKNLALKNPKKAYEKLDKEYREKRFGNYEKFILYINENSEDISNIEATSYLINRYETYTEYVIKDQYENIYVFKETEIMKYTLTLDTYTLEYEKFDEEYKSATNKQKVLMNLDKFFEMINTKDYTSAYALLDTSFAKTNFGNEATFKKYMKAKLYSYNKPEYLNFSNEISGVYTYYIEVSDKENKDNKKIKMNIVMQLLEGTDYRLSFLILN